MCLVPSCLPWRMFSACHIASKLTGQSPARRCCSSGRDPANAPGFRDSTVQVMLQFEHLFLPAIARYVPRVLDRKPSLDCRVAAFEPGKLLLPLIPRKAAGDPTRNKQNKCINCVTVLISDSSNRHLVWDRYRKGRGLQRLDDGVPCSPMHAGAALIGNILFEQPPNRGAGETL